MKSLKILLASLLLSTSVFSQTDKTPEERATAQTEKMKSELTLTAEQVEKVKTINLGIVQKNDNVRNSSITEEEKKAAYKMNEDARDSMIKGTLTAEQHQKYETLKAAKMEKRTNKVELKKANVKKMEITPAPTKN